jgi:antitoxin CptB
MDPLRSKLRYRAWHRGTREADLILGPFADAHLPVMTPAELGCFEALLDQPDPDLYAWITDQAQAPAPFDSQVLRLIRDFRFQARETRRDLGA